MKRSWKQTPKTIRSRYQVVDIVYCTSEYDDFELIGNNRLIDGDHLKRLSRSIDEQDLTPDNPIKVSYSKNSDKLRIKDGQTRFINCETKKQPVYFIFDKVTDEADIHRMNQNRRNWGIKDTVRFFAESEEDNPNRKAEYQAFQQFVDKYPFPITSCLAFFYGQYGSVIKELVQNGKLKVCKQMESVEKFAEQVVATSAYVPFFKDKQYVGALTDIFTHPKYDHFRMMKKLSIQRDKILKCTCKDGYIRLLEDIYNWHAPDKVRFL